MDQNSKTLVIDLIKQLLPPEGIMLDFYDYIDPQIGQDVYIHLEWLNDNVFFTLFFESKGNMRAYLIDYCPIFELKVCLMVLIDKLYF